MCLCHFGVNICALPHFNPRKKHVKTSFHDITASKRDVSGHIHPKRLLKHFFEPICLLDMSLNQNKPKISSLRTKHSYCIFRLSIQASRNKLNYRILGSLNLVPRVLRLLGQRFGRQERLWDNGLIQFF